MRKESEVIKSMPSHKLLTKFWSKYKICLNTEILLGSGYFRDFIKRENDLFENDIIEAWGYDSLEDD